MEAGDWIWIWLGAFVVFLIGELLTPGAFFLLGFAIGAVVAMLAAIVGADEVVQWALFVLVSGGAFAALRPLAHHMDRRADPSPNVGSTRLPGTIGVLTQATGPGLNDVGMAEAVSYTHLTLPTSDPVQLSVVAVALKQKKNTKKQQSRDYITASQNSLPRPRNC